MREELPVSSHYSAHAPEKQVMTSYFPVFGTGPPILVTRETGKTAGAGPRTRELRTGLVPAGSR
ncbi:hypothetical protein GCM10010360_14130 [Streptomyces nogalater]